MKVENLTKENKVLNKLKDKYRLIIYNDSTYHAVRSFRLTGLSILSALIIWTLVLIAVVVALIVYTPLKETIPGYPTQEMNNQLKRNAILVDSLEYELQIRDNYFSDLKTLIQGEVPTRVDNVGDTLPHVKDIHFNEFNHDSIFASKLYEEQFNLSLSGKKEKKQDLSKMILFPPLKGLVTNRFNQKEGHFGIDVAGALNSRVSSVLNGTVISTGWTIETGYVIHIQHPANLISVYKHNAQLLKKAGDKVAAGEAIAIMGNSGEITTGPHLHFELWHEGIPLNPSEYINF